VSKIKVLDPLVANKIAAGEIIERPVSVVKELLENSLDAQADFIEIEIKDGGMSLIKVTDNGHGMDKEDAQVAFLRHATSKINTSKDLWNIKTFGFRGEALPSVAAVSQVLITTCDQSSATGTQLKLLGGKIENEKEIAFSQGTCIEVRNLFFNTPARRKFMKSLSFETGQITELVSKYSLGHPQVRFKLVNTKEVVLDTAGQKTTEERLNAIYGEKLSGRFIHIQEEIFPNFFVDAWLAPPRFNRNTRNQQIFFINGRLIKNIELSKALDQAYHTLIPKGRFPIALVSLTLPAIELDINIHPAKLQVKINNTDKLFNKIIELFKEKLWRENIVENRKSDIVFFPQKNDSYPAVSKEEKFSDEIFLQEPAPVYIQEEIQIENKNKVKQIEEQDKKNEEFIHLQKKEVKADKVTVRNIDKLEPLTQLNNTFILAQNNLGLYIIDQHTCHERILYEKFMKDEDKKKVLSENLLIPVTLTLTGQQEGMLLKSILILNELGFVLENFGPRTYVLRSIPVGLKVKDKEKLFIDLLEELVEYSNISSSKIKETILTLASCKGAVKANQKLTKEEMLYLLNELAQVDNPHTCPHGRPIFYHISMKELYKIFQRGEYRGV